MTHQAREHRELLLIRGVPVVGFGDESVAPPSDPKERLFRGDAPRAGFVGQAAAALPVASSGSPWGMALATSVVSAAAGWAIEEVVQKFRGKRRRR